jgi:SAM-dependent methyltransferase
VTSSSPDRTSERTDLRGEDRVMCWLVPLALQTWGLPEGVYDLVHARLLLIHMADPVEVLTRMAAVLRPGGVLLAEEPDVGLNYAFGHPDTESANDLQARLNEALRAAGADYTLGRRLPAMRGAAGLEVAGAEFTTEVTRAGDPLFEDNRLHDAQLTSMLLRLGFSEEEVAFRRSFFDSPGVGLHPADHGVDLGAPGHPTLVIRGAVPWLRDIPYAAGPSPP